MADSAENIFLNVTAPGDYAFQLNFFQGVERLSSLFEYTLIMTAQSNDIDFNTLMGQSVTVSLTLGSEQRTFNGIVGFFEQQATPFEPLNMWNVYRAVLYPQVWLLTFSAHCQIFQNMSTVAIIEQILNNNSIPFNNNVVSAGMTQREFCVQYNETDFAFISRLMEEVGIFYYFQQSEGGHTLVLADSSQTSSSCDNAATVSFMDSAPPHEPFMMTVSSCSITQRIVPSSNALISYNYLTPQTPLQGSASGPDDAGGGNLTSYREVFGEQTLGDTLTTVKLQSEDAPQKRVKGVSYVPFFLAGYSFTLENHPRTDANINYVLYEVIHEARIVEGKGHPIYNNQFQAFPSTETFNAPQITPRPSIYSTQTAVVTGQQGTDIYTEQYGRIKIKFHWDSSPQDDDTTSCWIRVATLWAGQNWGTLFTPRVGQEVVVSFIDGDPDNPLVIGTVYNGENTPPYLPDDPTKSTIKSQTSPSQGEATPGYNEFRFEDKQYSEEVYIHAQKDFNIDIQNDQNITLVGGSRAITLQAQAEENEENQGENQGNDSLTLNNGNKSLEIIKGNYSIQLNEGNITVTCSQGDVSFNITGNVTYTCSGSFNVSADGGINLKSGAEIALTSTSDTTVDAGEAVSISSGGAMSLKSGAEASLTSASDTSVDAGGAVNISGGGAVDIKATASVDVTGMTILLNG
ncbi:MAG: type VI secretion system tip protein VgrG [Alphaproteobacteria bacterium]|nr:type VI secretion system tip protein VgrG [Alphaproteobacteria bacterium]